ncbi:MAG TPA: 16S rRNA (cytidine(1402)-2'-O)-methyltransferase [Bacilli bacterium]|nr:16S rRNA (cytidine(1402)-2'-O)-methyltransferase [Bacilli bacterium]
MKRHQSFIEPIARLYLVATPIGNLSEMSPRALEVLGDVDYIACEDTRVSGQLLKHFNIKKPLLVCHEHNELLASNEIIGLLHDQKKIAYVSDAGYPGISDPGRRLVAHALDSNIKVSVISGPSAILNALVASGLDSDHFYFHGFLPSKATARKGDLTALYLRPETLIFYEAPHRILATLKAMRDYLGNRKACIARELTKKFEEYVYGTLNELAELDSDSLKGEMVIVVEGNRDELQTKIGDDEIMRFIQSLTDVGVSTKDAIRQASGVLKVNKNYIYKLMHRS